MKKAFTAILMVLILAGSAAPVLAAQPGTPEYERLKELKKARRAEKEREKANPSPKAKGFWQKEAERSGFAGTGAMFSNAVFSAVPLDKPNSRKTE